MPRDIEKVRERRQRHRARKHTERFGPDAGDQRGRHGNHCHGAKHHRWNASRMINSAGYVKLRVGDKHPLADANGYAYEHLVVWVSAGHPPPPAGFVLHHKNEMKSDNSLDNLEMKSRSEHNVEHMFDRTRDERGRLLPRGSSRPDVPSEGETSDALHR